MRNRSEERIAKSTFFAFSFSLLAFSFCSAATAPQLPSGPIKGTPENDLPAPYNIQVVVLNKEVTISWQWQGLENSPAFEDFGYEVQRNDGKTTVITESPFSDFDLAFGTYSYRVRARGGVRFRGRHVNHISDWSETVNATIQVTCPQAPTVTLQVEPTKQTYSSIPSLRMHLTGDVTIPQGCSLTGLHYHIDTGTGLTSSGLLHAQNGHFDEFVNAMGPDDEMPTGSAVFTVTATAADEVGPTTSDAYTINIELQNPFAPREPGQ